MLDENVVARQQILNELLGEAEPACLDDVPRFLVELLGWDPGDLAGGPGGPDRCRARSTWPGRIWRDARAHLRRPRSRRPRRLADAGASRGATRPDLDALPAETARAALARHAASALRAPAARRARPHRPAHQRHARAPGLRPARRVHRPPDLPRGPARHRRRSPGARRAAHAAGRRDALHRPAGERLPAVLRESRKYQNTVSTRLAEQVLQALHELLRGFQAAHEASQRPAAGRRARAAIRRTCTAACWARCCAWSSCCTPKTGSCCRSDAVYQRHYSLLGLHERLRDDAARHPDTLDQRYGAWAQLLTLFRVIHDGAAHGRLRLPARHGRLFDPDTWDFLEGRAWGDDLDRRQRIDPPLVSDGVVWRVLDKLLRLDGDRISYRALDVEQIGSVYEAMMGFERSAWPRARRSPCGRPRSRGGRPRRARGRGSEAARAPGSRSEAACDVTGKAAEALKAARTVDDAAGRARSSACRPSTPAPHPPQAGSTSSPPRSAAARARTTRRARSPSPSCAPPSSPCCARWASEAAARADPRPHGVRPGHGLGRVPGRSLPPPGRAPGGSLERPRRHARAFRRRRRQLIHARRLVAERCLYGVDKNRSRWTWPSCRCGS